MQNYLGEFPIDVQRTQTEWALAFIAAHAGVDGEHQKTWVIDQVARILNETPVVTTMAKWGVNLNQVTEEELRFRTGKPSQKYVDFVDNARFGVYGPETYSWDEGNPP